MKNGNLVNLNPSPISNFIPNSLFCSHFSIFCSPRSFPVPLSELIGTLSNNDGDGYENVT